MWRIKPFRVVEKGKVLARKSKASENMYGEEGGYLNITDISNIYSISARNLRDFFRICDDNTIKKAL